MWWLHSHHAIMGNVQLKCKNREKGSQIESLQVIDHCLKAGISRIIVPL